MNRRSLLDNNVPLCAAVKALPPAALRVLALALAVLGLRRSGRVQTVTET